MIATTAMALGALAGCGEQPRTSPGGADGEGPSVSIYTPSPDAVRSGPRRPAPAKLSECGRYVAAPRGPGDRPEPQYCAEIVTDLVSRRPDMSGDRAAEQLISTSRPLTAQDRAEGVTTATGRIVDVEAAYRAAGLNEFWDQAERRMAKAQRR